ncbi:MAG: hypothetical protein OEX97_05365 [Acidimicrobiia bacterium]|nr:hypothetical protein [Acidimicrobiia bacterium]
MRLKTVILVAVLIAGLLPAGVGAGAVACATGQFEVSGTVTDAMTGLPLDRVTSIGIVYAADGSGYDGEGTDPATSAFATCLPIGEWKIAFDADYYFTEWYDDAPSMEAAAVISVVDGPVTGIDAALQPWPSISGRITDVRTGEPLPLTSVGIYQADTGDGIDGEGVDANGEFMYYFSPDYFTFPVRVKVNFAADYHWAEWYDNSKRFSRATVITIEADSGSITGIDASVRRCSWTVPDFCFQRKFWN